jgi:GrpB-like predicted nucleotidyltransferase (UPF0157 family)
MRPRPDIRIETHQQQPAVIEAYDPRAAEVAERVAGAIRAGLPSARVEHVGSTAVENCAGKGVVDLAVLYPPGELAIARDVVDALGFQRQTGRDPFPEDRPMRVGAIEHDGRLFRLHVHVISADSEEAVTLPAFRDALRADPALRNAYVARKREIIAGGVTDSLDYCYAKSDFVVETLWRLGYTQE